MTTDHRSGHIKLENRRFVDVFLQYCCNVSWCNINQKTLSRINIVITGLLLLRPLFNFFFLIKLDQVFFRNLAIKMLCTCRCGPG